MIQVGTSMTEHEHCHKLIARFYEMPVHEMGGGLTIVSLPGWMDAKDVDLIKRALSHLAATGDGVTLQSMAHPDGLIEQVADAIKSGKLKLTKDK